MIPELGLFLLIIGFLLTLFQISYFKFRLPIYRLTFIKFFCLFLSFLVLAYSFLEDDFSVAYVFQHSHAALFWVYKIGAIWGGHSGSLLLFQVFFACMVWICTYYTKSHIQKNGLLRQYPKVLFSLLGLMEASLYALLLFKANPFLRILPNIPLNGVDLNPTLQDAALMIHPPILYIGYVGCCFPYAFVLANRVTSDFISIKSWVLISFAFLTIGIALGSWWAYYELGWGGFWFWDPVENASLIPWLLALSLIHALSLYEKNKISEHIVSILALFLFLSILLSFLLVRSGLVNSVHAFAQDAQKGIFLGALLVVFSCVFSLIYFSKNSGPFVLKRVPLFSSNCLLYLAVALLFGVMLIVLSGTLFPLVYLFFKQKLVSVGPAYFNTILGPITALAAFILILSSFSLIQRKSVVMAHFGFLVMLIGIVASSYFEQEKMLALKAGEKISFSKYWLVFNKLDLKAGHNYIAQIAYFDVYKKGNKITTLKPEKRFFFTQGVNTSEIAIHPGLMGDIYLTLGEPLANQKWSLKAQYKPFVRFIWIGAIFMAIGSVWVFQEAEYRSFVRQTRAIT